MNPSYNPAESVQVQMGGYASPVQPGAPQTVPYTSVNVTTESPKDHIIWSLFSFFYCNPFCLGLAALAFSIKARDRNLVGDVQGARNHSSTAKNLNIAAVVLGLFTFIIVTTFVGIAATRFFSEFYSLRYHNRYYP